MNPEQFLRDGRLEECLAALNNEVRAKPADKRLRLFLFQLNLVLGRWDKALNQLQVAAEMDSEAKLMANVFAPLVHCEALRREVFAGKRSPLIFGEPDEWVGWLVQANLQFAQGHAAAADELRQKALDAAPATPGKLDGQPFQWLADADLRFGPVIELMLEGKYFWVPIHRIRRIVLPKPSDLRDLVFLPVQLVWANGGEASGHIPSRYPGTETAQDGNLRLARTTDWTERDGWSLGVGQRLLATDEAEHPLLNCRMIDFGV